MTRCSFRLRSWFFLILLLVAGLRGGLAQSSTATISGTVVDVTGASIANADVTVLNTATGISRQAKSDADGRYFVNSLIPGSYQVTGELAGFSKKVLKDITLNVGADVKLDVALAIGEASTVVEVQAQGLLVDTQGSSNGTVIDNKAVVELPLANRQFYSLALLSPAAYQPAQNSTLGFRGGINIAGASEISNQFTVNGTYDNDMGVAQPSFRPSVEVIQEFKLLTGVYSAEYGRMSGGQLNIITKSGTNTFHGSAYEFIRNQVTDAKPYFNPAGAKTPAFRQNTFGGTIGGPIWKDKTFFFFGYEGQRIGRAVTALATVPTRDQVYNGLFTTTSTLYNPNTGAPLTPVSTSGTTKVYNLTSLPQWTSTAGAAAQTIAKLGYPTPNIAGSSAVPSNNFNFSETRVENMNEESLKIDHKISEKDSLNGTWNYFRDPAFEPSNSLCSSYVLPNFGCFTDQHSTLANVVYDRIFTPNLINEVRAGFQRLVQPRIQQDATTLSYPGLPGGPYFTQAGYANNTGLPNTTVAGYSTIGGATNLPQDRWDDHYQLVDVLTWNHKNHTFKAGVDFLLARATNIITSSGRGAFSISDANLPGTLGAATTRNKTGDSMADFLLGYTYTSSVGTTAPTVYLNFQSDHLFVLDDWKVTPHLTLNLGLRWELDQPVYSGKNTLSNFSLTQGQFITAGNGNYKHLYNYDWNNFAPRVGFAWQPFGSEKTVVKGAGGMFYNTPLLYNQFLTNGTQFPFRAVPTFTATAATPITLANPFPGLGTSVYNPCTVQGTTGCQAILTGLSISPNYSTPYITEWSLGVQQALSKAMVAEVTYFGSKGTKLPLSINSNQINPAAPTSAGFTQAGRPYSSFSNITSQNTRANSEFHSLQTSLRQQFTDGLSFLVAYTFAKSIDGGGGIGSGSNSSGTVQNSFNLRADRGLSDFDVRHRLVISPVYQLPFGHNKPFLNHGFGSALAGGFQLSGIFSFQTGRPFTISNSSTNGSGTFGNADRPNLVGDPNASVDSVTGAKTHTVQEWFNTHAFALAATPTTTAGVTTYSQTGQLGNAGRNIVTGPRYTELDMTLARSFPIYERVNGQFRVEGFNLANHPNFFNPLTQGVQVPTTFTPNGTGGVTTASSTTFGAITQANDNREFQFSLRILF
ncbi:TonB-dependent receptor [Granulicella sp. dw_53]|uniref:TonB-dependent receptor n=1 Tax=Granulicella sp. dw_53 TaxID=2719792 RepID=UPI001BD60BF9|nr:TonB-dependent receptor [Granulicella sp. dw_53]